MQGESRTTHAPTGIVIGWFAIGTRSQLLVLSLGAVLFLASVYTTDALDIVREEQAIVAAEREVFDEFAQRVARIDPSPPQTGRAVPSAPLVESSWSDQLDRVRNHYEETVMALPHDDQGSDEALRTAMATDFGDHLATAVLDGDQFTPQLKAQLLVASKDARNRRAKFYDILEEERNVLDESSSNLDDIESELSEERNAIDRQSFESISGVRDSIDSLADRCEETILTRQQQIQRRTARLTIPYADVETLHAYLYTPLEVTYPVLADAVDLMDRIQAAREAVTVRRGVSSND